MGLQYRDLDADVRRYMVEEIEADVAARRLYLSNYLNDGGQGAWGDLLIEAARNGNDDSLARAIRDGRHLKQQVERRKPKGGFTMVRVPVTAHETLAEAQFNQYYMRGLARVALDRGLGQLTVYRAKHVENPRPQSEQMIGTGLAPQFVLDELRRTLGIEPEIGIPLPNSGLCVTLG